MLGELEEGRRIIARTREALRSDNRERTEEGIRLVLEHKAAGAEAVRLLSDEKPHVRENAAIAIGRLAKKGIGRPAGSTKALVDLIEHHQVIYLRAARSAAWALEEGVHAGARISENMIKTLERVADKESDHELRLGCLLVLGAMEDRVRRGQSAVESVHWMLSINRE